MDIATLKKTMSQIEQIEERSKCYVTLTMALKIHIAENKITGSRPNDHYFRSVCWFVCLFVCAEFFSAVFDPTAIKLGHVICLGLVVSPRI